MEIESIYKLFRADTFRARTERKTDVLLLFSFCLLIGAGCQSRSDAAEQQQEESVKADSLVDTTTVAGIAAPDSQSVNRIHRPTGLILDEGYLLVQNNCSSCHSLDLVKNKRASREGWLSTIRWMQQTQGLWNLGSNEKPILDYLAKNYAPEDMERRRQLSDIKWYILEE